MFKVKGFIIKSFGGEIKFMVFFSEIIYVKGTIILHVDAVSRQEFGYENSENPENLKDKISHRVETGILPLNKLRIDKR